MEKSVNSTWYTLSLRCFWDNKMKLFHCQWSKRICDQEKGFGKRSKFVSHWHSFGSLGYGIGKDSPERKCRQKRSESLSLHKKWVIRWDIRSVYWLCVGRAGLSPKARNDRFSVPLARVEKLCFQMFSFEFFPSFLSLLISCFFMVYWSWSLSYLVFLHKASSSIHPTYCFQSVFINITSNHHALPSRTHTS